MRQALIIQGGWDGHEPVLVADIFARVLKEEGFDVRISDTLDSLLDLEYLNALHLLVPEWTMGKITRDQCLNARLAVASGVGLAGCHGGMCDSFREDVDWQFMTGGQWVAHPGGIVDYTVNITDHADPITKGMKDFTMKSEQYYMHTDPGNQVLATTTFSDQYGTPWLKGTVMPVVWKRHWGQGRVFYTSLGHVAKDFEVPEVREILRRGMLWAAR